MAYCDPSCTIPSCTSIPVVGFGLRSGLGLATSGSLLPSALASAGLGAAAGLSLSCVSQIPAAEVVIQPPTTIVTMPGPILSSSCEPLVVGNNTPCAAGAYGLGAYGRELYGLGSGYRRFPGGYSPSISAYPF